MRRTRDTERRRRASLALVLVLLVTVPAWVPNRSVDRLSAAEVTAPGPIAIGDTVVGSTAAPGTVDVYSFFVPAAGVTGVLGVTDDSCGCQWSLAGPNGTVFDQPLGDIGPRWLAPGGYTLTVTSTSAGTYGFGVSSAPTPQPFSMALGATVAVGAPAAGAGNIESPGAEDAYAFTVPTAGASVVITVLANACACQWSLRLANGPLVLDRRPMTDTRIGLGAGTYSLRVTGGGAGTGTYSFATSATPASHQFSVALDATVSDGNPGPGAGNLEAPGALDVYAFAAEGATRVAIGGADCNADPSYVLVAPNGRILFRDRVCDAGNVIDLPETGNYEVRVSAGVAETGTYTLQLAASSEPATVSPPAADVFALAPGQTVANGAPATGAGNIEAADSHDGYVLDGAAGTTVVVDDKTTGGCSGLVWSATAPDGTPIVVDAPLGCQGSRTLRLGQTGRYEIDVRGDTAATGTYSFVVRAAPVLQHFATALGATIGPGIPAAGAGRVESAGALDTYTFTATRGQSVVLSDATAGGCVPIDAGLISPDDVTRSSIQLGCAGSVTVAAERTGTYTVVVAGRAAATGSYTLRIKASPPAATALVVAKREGAVKITWTAPSAAGGSPITNAKVSVFNASGGRPTGVSGALTRTVGAPTAAYTFTGLTNGVSYRFVIREQNVNGLGAPSALSAPMAPAANSRPNILFILTDDQRYDALSQLPTLNAQTNWLRFANSFVNEPMCCPSRASILTGRYSHHTKVTNLLQGRNLDDRTTIATMLRAAGYRTGFLGKYLNGYPFAPGHPVPPGWDNFEAYESGTGYYNYTVNRNRTPVAYGHSPADYSTDMWTGRASAFIRNTDAGKPFFLEVAYNAPHFATTGYPVPAPRHVGSCAGETFPLPASFNAHDQISEPAWLASQPAWNPATVTIQRRKTCETLRAVDEGVASLLDLLASIGRLSNTYVVLMSDNGYAFGEHSLDGKGDLFEESIRVPLIVKGPGIVPGSTNRLTSNIDLVPTFLAWAKTTAPAGFSIDGSSWAANARGATVGATSPTDVLLRGCRTSARQAKPVCGGYYGVPMGMNWGLRTASYKYIEYPDGYKQLFDLVHDPHELRNLATAPTKAALISNLHNRLVAKRTP